MLTDDDAELPDEKTGKPEKLKKIEEKAKVRREEANNSDISDDDVVAGEKSRDATDGGASRKDYSKKSVEDLEYLQEDIHKELAQITGESLQRKKHKKTSVSSSSTHRDQKHHKGTSHHKERERARDHAREHYRHENTETRRKYREESSRGRESSSKHRSDSRQRHERAGKSSPPGSYKRVVTVTKRPEAPQGAENGGKKKGLLSDSMREMIRAGVKEIKAPKDMRGMSTEVVDYDSDNSDAEHNILGDAIIGEGKTSDVSPAESEEDEEGPGKTEAEKSPIVPKLPPYLPGVRGCRNVEEFQWLNRIEEGTYGVVYRAKDKRTGLYYIPD